MIDEKYYWLMSTDSSTDLLKSPHVNTSEGARLRRLLAEQGINTDSVSDEALTHIVKELTLPQVL